MHSSSLFSPLLLLLSSRSSCSLLLSFLLLLFSPPSSSFFLPPSFPLLFYIDSWKGSGLSTDHERCQLDPVVWGKLIPHEPLPLCWRTHGALWPDGYCSYWRVSCSGGTNVSCITVSVHSLFQMPDTEKQLLHFHYTKKQPFVVVHKPLLLLCKLIWTLVLKASFSDFDWSIWILW